MDAIYINFIKAFYKINKSVTSWQSLRDLQLLEPCSDGLRATSPTVGFKVLTSLYRVFQGAPEISPGLRWISSRALLCYRLPSIICSDGAPSNKLGKPDFWRDLRVVFDFSFQIAHHISHMCSGPSHTLGLDIRSVEHRLSPRSAMVLYKALVRQLLVCIHRLVSTLSGISWQAPVRADMLH